MKAVVIGTIGHTELALEMRDRLPQVSFVGVAPGSGDENARELMEEVPGAPAIPLYDDYRRLLDHEKPDLAVVAPFFHLQAPIATECLERGIHVFVEKPMAVSMEQLEGLRRAHARGGAALCPMLDYRYHPAFHAAWCAVKDGLVGEPFLITAQKSYKLGTRPAMYRHRATYGGTIPWVAIHAIDWIHWMTGGRMAEVSASHTTSGNRGHGEMESSGACFYRLANGGCATLTFDYFRPTGAPTHGDDRLRVAGETGIVEVSDDVAMLLTHDAPPRCLQTEERRSIFVDFVRSIEGSSPLRITAADAFAVTETALRTREAADTGLPVTLRHVM